MLNNVTKKNSSLLQLEKELKELTNQPVHKSIQKNLNLDTITPPLENKPEPKNTETDVFGPKKKW
ncbi:MAG: hypothetical protein Q9M92_12550 [Enterobacterales bacterium]|nr:hypothetical protein [Enterobacterales bacterium]